MDDLIGRAIKGMRAERGFSLRELARRARISAAALSRIEAGEVKQPSMETLGALARALDLNPRYLWILSGHIEGDDARRVLGEAIEIVSIADSDDIAKADVADARALLARDSSTTDDLRSLAYRVFMASTAVGETWWDAYLEPLVRPLTQDLRTMIESYELLSFERKRKVQEYVLEQSELNLLETRREMGEDV